MSTLNEDLDKGVAKAKMGTTLVLILGIVSVVGVGYWLNYAHDKFVAFTPEVATSAGVGYVKSNLPELEPTIKEQIVSSAPNVIKLAEDQLTGMPDQFADMIVKRTNAELDQVMPQLTDELYNSMKSALTKIKDERGAGITDAEHAKGVLSALVDTYEKESNDLIDEIKTKYSSQGTDVLAHLEHLADNKKLTRRESLERQALVTFLTIASRAKTANAGM